MADFTQNLYASGVYLSMTGTPTPMVSSFYGQLGAGHGCGGCGCVWDEYAQFDDRAAFRRQLDTLTTGLFNNNAGQPNGLNSNLGEKPNTNNYADCFNKIDSNKLHQLQTKEAEIDRLQKAFDEATDKNEKKQLANQLKAAKDGFHKLESSLIKGTLPTVAYKDANFKYSNISDEELDQIHESNTEIANLKKKADDMHNQLLNKQAELDRKRQEIIARGGNPNDVKSGMSKEEIAAIDNMRTDYDTLIKEIADKITELGKNIKEAGSSTESTDFTVAEQERSSEAGKSESKAGKKIAEKLFKDDKLISRNELEKIYTKAPYTNDNVKNVLDTIYSECDKNSKKEDVIKFMQSKDFMKAIRDSQKFDSSSDNINNTKLLEEVYDEITGTKGSFKEFLEACKSDNNLNLIAGDILEALSDTKSATTTTTTSNTTESSNVKNSPSVNKTASTKPVSEVTQQEIDDAKNRLLDEDSRTDAIEKLPSEVLIAVFKDQSVAQEITQSFFDGDNDDVAAKELLVRFNKIAEERGIRQRLFADTNWTNSIEIKDKNHSGDEDVFLIDEDSDIDVISSCAWSTWNNNMYKPLARLAGILAKQ